MQMDYSSYFIFLYRTFKIGSGAINFMGETSKHILSTEIFPDFIHLYSRGDKKNKNSKPLILQKVLLGIWFSNFY